MSWYNINTRMNSNITDGTEYCINDEEKKEISEAGTKIGHCKCDYCGQENLLAIFVSGDF